MKTFIAAAALAVCAGSTASAQDFNFKVTNLRSEGSIAPLIVLDAVKASPVLFTDEGAMTEPYITTVLEGDPRPMNGTMPDAVAGPVLGTSGPPGVYIDAGEVAMSDMFIFGNTLRFYAKDNTAGDVVVTGVYDISAGPGTVLLNAYDIGHDEGTMEMTLVEEGVIEVVITSN